MKRIAFCIVVLILNSPLFAVNVLVGKAQFTDARRVELSVDKKLAVSVKTPLCVDETSCVNAFFLEDRSPLTRPAGFVVPGIKQVEVSDDPSQLLATLNGDLSAFDDIIVVAKDVSVVTDLAGTTKPFRVEFVFPMTITDIVGETPRLRLDLPLKIPRSQLDLSTLKIVDADTGQEILQQVSVEDCDQPCNHFILDLSETWPPNRTLKVAITIPQVGKLGGTVKTPGGPKNRDEAREWLSMQGVLTQGAKDTLVLDTMLQRLLHRRPLPRTGTQPDNNLHFRLKEWNAVLDVNAGSDKLKLPDYGSFSTPFLFQLQHGSGTNVRTEGTLSLAPEFRTDKKFHNRDLGVTPLYQPILNSLNHSVDQRRKANPLANSGHSLVIAGGAETGWHLASPLPEIDHSAFIRILIRATETLEWKQWRLSGGLQIRHLLRDELTTDNNSVLRTRRGERVFARTELSYDLGFAALSVVNTSGRVPPAFNRARATTIGLTFKR